MTNIKWKNSIPVPYGGYTKYQLFARSVRIVGKLMEHEHDAFAPYRDGFRSTASFEDALSGSVRAWRKQLRAKSKRHSGEPMSYAKMTLLLAEAWQYDLNHDPATAADILRSVEANLRWRWKERNV